MRFDEILDIFRCFFDNYWVEKDILELVAVVGFIIGNHRLVGQKSGFYQPPKKG